jgi:hypothetical protein
MGAPMNETSGARCGSTQRDCFSIAESPFQAERKFRSKRGARRPFAELKSYLPLSFRAFRAYTMFYGGEKRIGEIGKSQTCSVRLATVIAEIDPFCL